jgi:hypothetical protein
MGKTATMALPVYKDLLARKASMELLALLA